MGTTTNFGLRYPAAGASNNVPADFQNLATDTDTALNGRQPVDADLSAFAALDSTSSGVVASDGSGWIRKTYSAVKTSLSLVKGDVGLGSVDNTADTAKPVSTAQQTALDLKVSYVNHGSTAGTTRPATASEVLWVGSATPSNGATNDLWWDTTNVLLKRYTGSVWAASGSTAYAAQSAAWNTWSPVITGATTNPTYTDNGSAYRVDGKTLFFRLLITYNTAGVGQHTLAMPGGLTAQLTYGVANLRGNSSCASMASVATGNHIQFVNPSNAGFGSGDVASGFVLGFSGVIETT